VDLLADVITSAAGTSTAPANSPVAPSASPVPSVRR